MFLDYVIDMLSYLINSQVWTYFFLPAFCFALIIIFSHFLKNLVRWYW